MRRVVEALASDRLKLTYAKQPLDAANRVNDDVSVQGLYKTHSYKVNFMLSKELFEMMELGRSILCK